MIEERSKARPRTMDEFAMAGLVMAALVAGSLPALIVALYIS